MRLDETSWGSKNLVIHFWQKTVENYTFTQTFVEQYLPNRGERGGGTYTKNGELNTKELEFITAPKIHSTLPRKK